ncbi:amidohydrolase [Formosa maritima]|jgi:predicted amidohydrolase|uniref:Omega-amidase YafV n=1 Tax=Formosa maritima TaxID=2592046 RepID=A0A5D0GM14_9FLAO|nr:amidohydrolase [Formosa maritima]TYA60068.1 amidohydrolase [Formosa maritima]
MQNELKIALIQTELFWENPEQNRIHFTKKIEEISKSVDLIVLPEMFTTGFTMNPKKVAETMFGETVVWMQNLALLEQTAIMGSMVISEDGKFYNRMLFVHPNGIIETYDKKHTFTLAGEDKVYTAGQSKLLVTYKGWKICPLICYDLRFPVWARNVEDYDVLIYVANWPKVRITAWDALLKARAIENMSYCVGVNRVGLDDNGHEYSGHSAVYDVLGHKLDNIPENLEATEVITLSKSHIKTYREKLNFLSDKDAFKLE